MNKKFRNVANFISFIELHDVMHSLLDIAPCPPEGLLIHSVCQICVYIFGGFAGCSTGNRRKSGEKRTFKIKLKRLRGLRTNVPHDACTEEQAMWWIICSVYFMGD